MNSAADRVEQRFDRGILCRFRPAHAASLHANHFFMRP
jgi:hypothetical protein